MKRPKSSAPRPFAGIRLALALGLGALWLPTALRVGAVEVLMIDRPAAEAPDLAGLVGARAQATAGSGADGIPAWWPQPAGPAAPAPDRVRIGGRVFQSMQQAADALTPGATLDIGPGVYTTPLVIRVPGVSIIGHGRVVFAGAVAQGKATLVIAADDTRVRNIECRQVAVRDGNGACIRLEGKDLTLEHCYFHDSQQGVLTGPQPGLVTIRRSRFERLGHGGQAHGIYIGGGRLAVADSLFLASQGEGHEIKSRAAQTTIERSVIASQDGVDSRLIDAPNGGELNVTGSLLAQGPNTSNSDLIGFGLERASGFHPVDRVVLRNNLILLERERVNRLLHRRDESVPTEVTGNIIVSRDPTPFDATNTVFRDRRAAGLPAYPALPVDRLPSGADLSAVPSR